MFYTVDMGLFVRMLDDKNEFSYYEFRGRESNVCNQTFEWRVVVMIR